MKGNILSLHGYILRTCNHLRLISKDNVDKIFDSSEKIKRLEFSKLLNLDDNNEGDKEEKEKEEEKEEQKKKQKDNNKSRTKVDEKREEKEKDEEEDVDGKYNQLLII